MGLEPSIGWDKPFVYGPLIAALSLRLSLALPVMAQSILLSAMLWQTARVFARHTPWSHIFLCTALATVTASAWFSSTVMPDIFTPIACLALIVSAYQRSATTVVIAAVAIAAHLSNLILAAALIAGLTLTLRAIPWRPILSLALALSALIATNAVAYHRIAVSPYGSVFLVARLVADGSARAYLDRACPGHDYILCHWRDRLTGDSDQFLWDPNGPFWSDPAPLPEFAAEAGQIVQGTALSEPMNVLRDAYRDTLTQLLMVQIGDTLTSNYLTDAVQPRIARWFPQAELQRFLSSRQMHDDLAPIGQRLNLLYLAAIVIGMGVSAATLVHGLRRPSRRADFAALIILALLANALATGAFSGPHNRYQARIAWLILLPALFRFDRDPLQPVEPDRTSWA